MKLFDIIKVRETTHTNTVNEYLSEGWVLLETSSGCYPENGEAYICYSLGLPKQEESSEE